MRTLDVPVLIVGAGPAGLMTALLLERLGVESLVVERRSGPQRAPAAHVVGAPLADRIAILNLESDSHSPWGEVVRLLSPAMPHAISSGARQVYRIIDEHSGLIVEDILAPIEGEPLPGRPLLLTVIDEGGVIRSASASGLQQDWIDRQRAAWPSDGLPIRVLDRPHDSRDQGAPPRD